MIGIIDVGSNSIKFLLASKNPDGTVNAIIEDTAGARLGEGLRETGAISQPAMERNAEAIAAFANTAREHGATEIIAVGTMALRSAKNAQDFINMVQDKANITLKAIPGEEEARLAYLAVLSALPVQAGGVAIFDTGGGSTEFIFGEGTTLQNRFSLDVGAVIITEKYFTMDPVTPEAVDAAMADITGAFSQVKGDITQLIGMGGTVTSMGAVKHQMEKYDPDIIQGSTITLADVNQQIEMYAARTIESRKEIIGLQPKRADVILAGACILKAILTCLNADALTISDRGLRHGLAFDIFATN